MPTWLLVLPFLATAPDSHSLDQANVHLAGNRSSGAGGRGGDARVNIQNVPGGTIIIVNPQGGNGGNGGPAAGPGLLA